MEFLCKTIAVLLILAAGLYAVFFVTGAGYVTLHPNAPAAEAAFDPDQYLAEKRAQVVTNPALIAQLDAIAAKR